jgi:hypothetical protein
VEIGEFRGEIIKLGILVTELWMNHPQLSHNGFPMVGALAAAGSHGLNLTLVWATVNQHPLVHQPLDAHYYSVVDEPTSTELNVWFHLGNQFCRKLGLIHR